MDDFTLPGHWPEPADPEAGRRLADGLRPRGSAAERALLASLGGNSPYLADLCRRETAFLDRLLRRGPDWARASCLRPLTRLPAQADRAEVAASLRTAKRQMALASAIADIGGLWSLEQVTAALSALAEAALEAALRHLLHVAAARGELGPRRTPPANAASGFVILGMGKLGARELNYSSDIDLILLHDPAAHPALEEPGRVFVRMGAELVSLMQTRDEGGYVFRTDLRLRPDPGSTPLVVSLPAAITYYESLGQTWERAAMIKARPVAGDIARGAGFLQAIRPFVWRRHLDFTVIEDIRAMKGRIDRHRGLAPLRTDEARGKARSDAGSAAGLLGYDLKRGPGGIREIEFICQATQLVWGGREPDLREPTTLGALTRLAADNYLTAAHADALARHYRLLRRIEHRLQMQQDRQTHSLPADPAGLDAFAHFLGEPDASALAGLVLPALHATHAAFSEIFGPAMEGATLDPGASELEAQLATMGFPQPTRAATVLARWDGAHIRALRSDRARQLLRQLLPSLLAAFAEQHEPLGVLVRFDRLLAQQSGGVQLLSLLSRNPPLLGRLAAVLDAAPSLADHLAAVPAALEGLLVPEEGTQAAGFVRRLLDAQMRATIDAEQAAMRARPLVRGEEFRLSLAQLDGTLDVDQAGLDRTRLAEHVIARMLDRVLSDHRRRFGSIDGGGMVVVTLGKAGSREMMAGSDLDLMLIYDHPEEVTGSSLSRSVPLPEHRRRRELPASQYYTRLAHALIAALSLPGLEGPLYALDMRLRPSGNKGPVAVSLAAFRHYHAASAWTWERMALSRARVVAGPAALRRAVTGAIERALLEPGLPRARILADAAAMRGRLAAELPPRGALDIKLLPGGLMEVEFIAQALQLAARDRAVLHPTTASALGRLARAGHLPRAEATALQDADRFWRAVQGLLRILFGASLPQGLDQLSAPALDALLGGVAASCPGTLPRDAGRADLAAEMARRAGAVRAAFVRLVGAPTPPIAERGSRPAPVGDAAPSRAGPAGRSRGSQQP